jgi:Ser/Thr protein kinase RdoA (MazF antagonist)
MDTAIPTSSSAVPRALARAASGLLDRYEFSPDVTIGPLHQSENTMFLVRDQGGARKSVLRIHSQRMAYHTAPSIESELRWMMALRRETGIETPEVVPARDGSLIQILAAPDLDQPRHAVMFTFLEGSEPTEDRWIEGFERLGEITARMHRHAQQWPLPANFVRHRWDGAAVLGAQPLWGRWQDGLGIDDAALRILDRLASVIERRLAKLGTDPARFGLIHADLRLANLLVEGSRTKVIDFDDCGFSWLTYDLATAVSFIQHRPEVTDLIASWLQGYRKIAALPPDLEAEIPTIILLRRLAEIAWIAGRQHIDFARGLGAGFTAESCRLAEDYLQRFG